MTAPQDGIVLDIHREKGTKARVVVKLAGVESFVDRVDLASDVSRHRFTKKVCAKCQGVDPDKLQAQLDAVAVKALGSEPVAASDGSDGSDGLDAASQADLVVHICRERYLLGRTTEDEPFAVPRDGPPIARMLRGSRHSLRVELAREFQRAYKKVPSSSALADALVVIEGEAMEAEAETVHLRVAQHESQVVLDLGTPTGSAVVIGPAGWKVVEKSPVLFRHTELTSRLPEPVRGGCLTDLRSLINLTDEGWQLLIGWIVAAFFLDIPHPIALLGGQYGTGKSTTARFVVTVFDASPAPLRSCPRDLEQWAVAANGSWTLVIDNISRVPEWWSDAMCRAVTGDGMVRRKLYTDSGLSVLVFHRVLMLTSIDPGALKGDLGDRILLLDLEKIQETQRRPDADLKRQFETLRPAILGALLDLVAKVLKVLPDVRLERHARMADFCKVLAAVDTVLGTSSLYLYLGQRERVAADVVESDLVADAVRQLIELEREFRGNSTELLAKLTPDDPPRGWPPKGWPRNPRSLSATLRNCIPALNQIGIVVEDYRDSDRGRKRLFYIHLATDEGEPTVRTVRPSESVPDHPEKAGSPRTVGEVRQSDAQADRPKSDETLFDGAQDGSATTVRTVRPSDDDSDDDLDVRTVESPADGDRPTDRPTNSGPPWVKTGHSDGSDGLDGCVQHFSTDGYEHSLAHDVAVSGRASGAKVDASMTDDDWGPI